MARFVTASDLDPLFASPLAVPGAMAAIAESVRISSAHRTPVLPWQRLPLDRGHLRLALGYVPTQGATLRTYPVGAERSAGQRPLYALWNRQGELLAVFSDERLSLWRTAAPAWLAVSLLHPHSIRHIALIGSGRQAEGQLWGWAALAGKTLQSVRVFSPTRPHREAFAAKMSQAVGRAVTPVASAKAAVHDADLVGVCSNSPTPVLESEWLKPGALVVSIADGQLPADLVKRSALYVSERSLVTAPEAARRPFADLVRAGGWEGARADLAELVTGQAPRPLQDRPTLFEMPGMGVWDTAVAHWAYQWAEAERRGVEF